ncbi:MAG: DUF3014 domain-containing protein [Burkholderiaceae bacterium]
MERTGVWIAGTIALIAAVLGGYAWWKNSQAPVAVDQPPVVETAATPAPAPPAPTIEHPIEPAAKAEPAPPPSVDASDPALVQELAALFPSGRVPDFVVPQNLIRNLVATIDNLPREKTAYRLMPIRPAGGSFETVPGGESVAIAPGNAARYAPTIALVERVNAKQLASLYKRFYPLFQQAYVELGYPTGYFNDRLVAVIDHLLATPDVAGPIELVQPKVLYRFADPQLEALSVGQKGMIRIGPVNAAKLKLKLRELREEVAKR